MARQIAGEQWIALRTGQGLLDVNAVFRSGAGKSDERCRKFHLGIVAAKKRSLLHPRVAVETGGGIAFFAEPLSVGLREIAGVEASESVGVSGGVGIVRASDEFDEQFFCGARIRARE